MSNTSQYSFFYLVIRHQDSFSTILHFSTISYRRRNYAVKHPCWSTFKYTCRTSWQFQLQFSATVLQRICQRLFPQKRTPLETLSQEFQKYPRLKTVVSRLVVYSKGSPIEIISCKCSVSFKAPLKNLVWSSFLVACKPATPVERGLLKISKKSFSSKQTNAQLKLSRKLKNAKISPLKVIPLHSATEK